MIPASTGLLGFAEAGQEYATFDIEIQDLPIRLRYDPLQDKECTQFRKRVKFVRFHDNLDGRSSVVYRIC